MPTQHIEPASHGHLLQDVANALLKARKVVVVTGAGISTNSGIPDFRSENGLYSLIQAQFDNAARLRAETGADSSQNQSSAESSDTDDGPPRKKRRISIGSPEPVEDCDTTHSEIEVSFVDSMPTESSIVVDLPSPEEPMIHDSITVSAPAYSTPKRQLPNPPATSPLSSPPPDEAIVPPSIFRGPSHRRLTSIAVPLSSSPLSSPPPNLFDPFDACSSHDASSRRSTSPSEVDETPPSTNPFGGSQSSLSGKTTLPNMKGKDLFDASIWADPLRTSVFYTFATTLRQKIRDVQPTSSHRFISHLRDRGKLVRCYTQNIDQIEEKVGLSTTLQHGPGSRGRFSRRSTATNSQLSKMVEEVTDKDPNCPQPPSSQSTQSSQPTQNSSQQSTSSDSEAAKTCADAEPSSDATGKSTTAKVTKADLPKSGVECVFLHGSLEQLRCFRCSRVSSWNDLERETLSGLQPECPHCSSATAAREERGKRALGVGKLRPDIVLYGEEHPNAHLISPIVTHDLALSPDMLLILGTSLRVHGLKIMVREFAKAVHAKGGKVVFVNLTKPPESSWGDVIDYWVQWDCDAWVADLQDHRVPQLWQTPEPPKLKKRLSQRESSGGGVEDSKPEVKKPPPANPVALRDTKVTGAYWSLRCIDELHRITGEPARPRRASVAGTKLKMDANARVKAETSAGVNADGSAKPRRRPRPRGPRQSAPAALDAPETSLSTLNPNHGREVAGEAGLPELRPRQSPLEASPWVASAPDSYSHMPKNPSQPPSSVPPVSNVDGYSMVSAVKTEPRNRKRKTIDGQEVELPKINSRRTLTPKSNIAVEIPSGRDFQRSSPASGSFAREDVRIAPLLLPTDDCSAPAEATRDLQLAPLSPRNKRTHIDHHRDDGTNNINNGKPGRGPVPAARHKKRLPTMEPRSPPAGPLASISPNMRSAAKFGEKHAFYIKDPLVRHGHRETPVPFPTCVARDGSIKPACAPRFTAPRQQQPALQPSPPLQPPAPPPQQTQMQTQQQQEEKQKTAGQGSLFMGGLDHRKWLMWPFRS